MFTEYKILISVVRGIGDAGVNNNNNNNNFIIPLEDAT